MDNLKEEQVVFFIRNNKNDPTYSENLHDVIVHRVNLVINDMGDKRPPHPVTFTNKTLINDITVSSIMKFYDIDQSIIYLLLKISMYYGKK